MRLIDLHVHSNQSDGTLSPSDLAAHAAAAGLAAFALTDHDNMDGVEEAARAAASLGIEVVPGIEFSTEYHGEDIHIVGLEPDFRHPDFGRRIRSYQEERLRRNLKMIQALADDGFDISYRQMADSFGEKIWTRAHFARYLRDHGYVREMKDAFRLYIGVGCKYYIPREKVSPFEVTDLLLRHGGIPILAHPFLYHLSDGQLRRLIGELKQAGLVGMEVYYSTHTPGQEAYAASLAQEFGLLPSGGSDFHGANKPDISIGTGRQNLKIPYAILERLRAGRPSEPAAHTPPATNHQKGASL